MGAGALAVPTVIAPILIPIALIIIASMRGSRIDKLWLFWLPIGALLLSILPWAIYSLAKQGFGLKDVPTYFGIVLSMLATLGPIVLHVVCATLGAQNTALDERICPVIKHAKTR